MKYEFTVEYRKEIIQICANHPDEIAGIINHTEPPIFSILSVRLIGSIEKPDKYFLCFGFDNFCNDDLKPFHVTLIYFGELTDVVLEKVKSCISDYKDSGYVDFWPELIFHIEEMFGPNKDIKVLLPAENSSLRMFKNEWLPLREKLESVLEYKGYPFNPHLTTSLSLFKGRINSLHLCKNNYEVIQSWYSDD